MFDTVNEIRQNIEEHPERYRDAEPLEERTLRNLPEVQIRSQKLADRVSFQVCGEPGFLGPCAHRWRLDRQEYKFVCPRCGLYVDFMIVHDKTLRAPKTLESDDKR